MGLLQDVPGELREFARVFERISYRHGDYGRVFGDFVSYLTGGMLLTGDPKLAEELKDRYGADYALLQSLVPELLKAYGVMIKDDNDWYDGLGVFYEVIASRYKSSALGQFFTPKPICDMMAQIVDPQRETVSDCCSGSGRMILAAKVLNPKIHGYGADLDPICARMTAINMALHGVVGEASCMNSLTMEWRFGYVVNPYLPWVPVPVPHLTRVESREESVFFVKRDSKGFAETSDRKLSLTNETFEQANKPTGRKQDGWVQLELF